MGNAQPGGYYFAPPSHWPIVGSVALLIMAFGGVMLMNSIGGGGIVFAIGVAILVYMMFRWFGTVIARERGRQVQQQVDMSFRWGMSWFIFSEVMFFAAFFGALFYMRVLSVPWLGAASSTKRCCGPSFKRRLAVRRPGLDEQFTPMGAWGIPALNTAAAADLGRHGDLRALGAAGRTTARSSSWACSSPSRWA